MESNGPWKHENKSEVTVSSIKATFQQQVLPSEEELDGLDKTKLESFRGLISGLCVLTFVW